MFRHFQALKDVKLLVLGAAAIAGSGLLLVLVHSLKKAGAADVVQAVQEETRETQERRAEIDADYLQLLIESQRQQAEQNATIRDMIALLDKTTVTPTGRSAQLGDVMPLDETDWKDNDASD